MDLKKYYDDAVELMKNTVKNPVFFIFSDEPQWVKENFKGEYSFTVVDCNGPDAGHEDMRLMSSCRHHIIANSSFSWWGAWLNPENEKKVIAPKAWFTDRKINTEDLIPERWVRL